MLFNVTTFKVTVKVVVSSLFTLWCKCSVHLYSLYCRFEVGVRVEGYAVGEEKRHINSAFFTFRPADTDCQLPELVTDTKVCSCSYT